MGFRELIFSELRKDTCFSNAGVSDDQKFDHVIKRIVFHNSESLTRLFLYFMNLNEINIFKMMKITKIIKLNFQKIGLVFKNCILKLQIKTQLFFN